jgi:hypothetical protein
MVAIFKKIRGVQGISTPCDAPREGMTNALFNDNRPQLGVFGLNVSNGCAATTAEGHLEPIWRAAAAALDRRALVSLCAAPDGVVTC